MTDKSQQVKEAAKRLRAIFDVLDELVGDFDPYISDDFTDEDVRVEHPLFWCCREVNRVLAEHPADDDELLTAEWLHYTNADYLDRSGLWRFTSGAATLVAYSSLTVWSITQAGNTVNVTIKTRGDVRRLCTALGIELNETTDSPQLGPEY